MFASINSLGVSGVGGYHISVEVNITNGLPGFEIVGLPDAAVKESKERVRAAIKNSGFKYPSSRITVNLAPADKRKSGTVYDLPVMIGILAAMGEIKAPGDDCAFIGELSLMGDLRPVAGALPMAIFAERHGIKSLFLPEDNAPEAAFADGVTVYPVKNIRQLVAHLKHTEAIEGFVSAPASAPVKEYPDFSDIKGQESVKRALEIAAAGGHNILLIGPPGAGKSMAAKRLPGILPDMTKEEMIESTEIYSVSGLTSRSEPVVSNRPFRSPHHTVSAIGLVGGGTSPKPGEISLAHNGILFLDELPEFRKDALEVLRQPLEDGDVTVSRVSGSVTFPSRFMLVCAMNPCKCGWYGHPSGRCRCSKNDVIKYRSRISGPLLDRIDIIITAPSLDFSELRDRKPGECSAEIKKRVNAARRLQRERFKSESIKNNSDIDSSGLRKYCALSPECENLMRLAFDRMNLTARSYDRILRVARTIADLCGSEDIRAEHIAEAIQYRTGDLRG